MVFASEDFDDIALLELTVEVAHFAVDFDADDVAADFAVKAEGEVEWKGTFGEVDDVALGCVDEDFVGEEVEAELFEINFLTFFELGGGVLKLSNPEEVGGQMLDLTFFVTFGKFLLVVIEAGGETAFGIFVHFASANLEFDDFFVLGNDSSMERLITVLFWLRNVILDAAVHGRVKGMNKTESEITTGDIGYDDAKCGKVVNLAEILIVLGELSVEGIDGLDAARNLELHLLFSKKVRDFFFNLF